MSTKTQGVEWVPGKPCSIVNWSSDLKLYKISLEERQYQPLEDVPEFVVNCQALKSELTARVGGEKSPHYAKCAAVQPFVEAKSPPVLEQPSSPKESGIQAIPVVTHTSNFNDIRVAVGQVNGRISLATFAGGGAILKEFGTRNSRACNDLAWNPTMTKYLAAAYDKNRNDHAILIFDASIAAPNVTVEPSPSAIGKVIGSGSKSKVNANYIGASIEVGLGETCHSLAWFRNNPETLVAGMNMKNLKIWDLRIKEGSGPKAAKTNVTRQTYGLCVDPHMDHRVASYYEDTVVIWDTRNFDKPIWTRSQSSDVVHLAWSPTRSGLLCSLVKNSIDTLTLHDIQSWAVMSEDGEPAVTQRVVNVLPLTYPDPTVVIETEPEIEGKDIITSFAWHPQKENLLVACRKDGRLAEVHVMERIAPSWASQHFLAWAHGGVLQSQFHKRQDYALALDDISSRMQRRARLFYFLPTQPYICEPEGKKPLEYHVKLAFSWLESCQTLMKDLTFCNQFPKKITAPGIRTAMGLDKKVKTESGESPFVLKSDITYKHWNMGHREIDQHKHRPKRVFKGDSRHRALRLCEWGVDESELKHFLEKLQAKGQYARAAAIAVFNLEIKMALQILEKVDDKQENFYMVAVALAGFSEEKSGAMWREMVKNVSKKIDHSYFKAMFEFLLIMTQWNGSDQETFSAIMNEEGLMPTDRVAFACLYLPDEKLSDYINSTWNVAKSNGDISSIYLCGASSYESIELLQQYVDITGDCQTASWICVHFVPPELVLAHDGPQCWITTYKRLLDDWSLYVSRAEFDNACFVSKVTEPVAQQVYVSCAYCGKALSRHTNGLPDYAVPAVNNSSIEAKKVQVQMNMNNLNKHAASFSTCPACKKPAPRCAVCQLQMGSHSGYLVGSNHLLKPRALKLTPWSKMFTWCQVCRHGGHGDHMEEWFKTSKECPVSCCNCRCEELDKHVNDRFEQWSQYQDDDE